MQQASLIQTFFEKVICNQQFELLSDMMTEDVVCISPQAVDIGRTNVRRSFEASSRAFTHLQVNVQFTAVSGNRAAVRICMRGQQSKPYAGIKNVGRRISLPCVYLFELRDHRICGIEVYYDLHLLASQIANGQVQALR